MINSIKPLHVFTDIHSYFFRIHISGCPSKLAVVWACKVVEKDRFCIARTSHLCWSINVQLTQVPFPNQCQILPYDNLATRTFWEMSEPKVAGKQFCGPVLLIPINIKLISNPICYECNDEWGWNDRTFFVERFKGDLY